MNITEIWVCMYHEPCAPNRFEEVTIRLWPKLALHKTWHNIARGQKAALKSKGCTRSRLKDGERTAKRIMHGWLEGKGEDDVTWEVRERSSLYNVLSIQGLQNLGAAEPLEATLHVVVIPFKRLCPQNPAREKGGWEEGRKKTWF